MLVSGIGMFKADRNRQNEGRGYNISMQNSRIMNEGYKNTENCVTCEIKDSVNNKKKVGFLSRIINLIQGA